MIKDLIGLEYGQIDCLSLMEKALKETTGESLEIEVKYNNPVEDSGLIIDYIDDYLEPTEYIQEGTVALFELFSCYHLAVFVNEIQFIHVMNRHTSQLSRFNSWWERHLIGLYKPYKEERREI